MENRNEEIIADTLREALTQTAGPHALFNPTAFTSEHGKYSCKTCDKTFQTHGGMYKHNKTVHGEYGNLISCPYCEKKFAVRSALMRHLPTHSDSRPHVCLICEKSFKRKDKLDIHVCKM